MRLFIPLLFCLFAVACNNNDAKETCCKASSSEQKPSVIELAQADLDSILEKENVVLIDVRTPEEIAQGYIPKTSSFIDYKSPDFETKINQLKKDETYVMYCRSGGRSGKASEFMIKNGFKNVYNLHGGILKYSGDLKHP